MRSLLVFLSGISLGSVFGIDLAHRGATFHGVGPFVLIVSGVAVLLLSGRKRVAS